MLNFTGNTQNEENVKRLCKKFFEEDNAQIVQIVNTLSENFSELADTHFDTDVNTLFEFFSEIIIFRSEIRVMLEEMEECYHYAMRNYPISEYIAITRKYVALKKAFSALAESIFKVALYIANAHSDEFVKRFSENNLINFREV